MTNDGAKGSLPAGECGIEFTEADFKNEPHWPGVFLPKNQSSDRVTVVIFLLYLPFFCVHSHFRRLLFIPSSSHMIMYPAQVDADMFSATFYYAQPTEQVKRPVNTIDWAGGNWKSLKCTSSFLMCNAGAEIAGGMQKITNPPRPWPRGKACTSNRVRTCPICSGSNCVETQWANSPESFIGCGMLKIGLLDFAIQQAPEQKKKLLAYIVTVRASYF